MRRHWPWYVYAAATKSMASGVDVVIVALSASNATAASSNCRRDKNGSSWTTRYMSATSIPSTVAKTAIAATMTLARLEAHTEREHTG